MYRIISIIAPLPTKLNPPENKSDSPKSQTQKFDLALKKVYYIILCISAIVVYSVTFNV